MWQPGEFDKELGTSTTMNDSKPVSSIAFRLFMCFIDAFAVINYEMQILSRGNKLGYCFAVF